MSHVIKVPCAAVVDPKTSWKTHMVRCQRWVTLTSPVFDPLEVRCWQHKGKA